MADKADQLKPKWQHFHPQSTVWLQNPLDHDVVYQVADEHNNPYQYRLPSHKISELPGGLVATLGVKAIVDELIQNNKEDALRIWDADVRQKYQDQVVMRVKQAPLREQAAGPSGEIDMSVREEKPEEDIVIPAIPPAPETKPEQAFPDLQAKDEVKSVANASLGNKDQIVEE